MHRWQTCKFYQYTKNFKHWKIPSKIFKKVYTSRISRLLITILLMKMNFTIGNYKLTKLFPFKISINTLKHFLFSNVICKIYIPRNTILEVYLRFQNAGPQQPYRSWWGSVKIFFYLMEHEKITEIFNWWRKHKNQRARRYNVPVIYILLMSHFFC